jgi:hypothetical protein
LLTQYDKAGAAAIGAALGTVIAYFFPMSIEQQGAVVILLSGILTYLIPNKEA